MRKKQNLIELDIIKTRIDVAIGIKLFLTFFHPQIEAGALGLVRIYKAVAERVNYVLKYHAEKYAEDEFSKIIKENLYVDNMLVTSNDINFLKKVYTETQHRLEEGGFTLRSWNSNSKELQPIMTDQGNTASYGNSYETVLGMKYILEFDSLQVGEFQLDASANIKRAVLSQISKVFDPLGLYFPVSNKGNFLMRELWAA